MLKILLWLLKLGRYLSERCIYLETTNCRIYICVELFASHGNHKQNDYSVTKIILKEGL